MYFISDLQLYFSRGGEVLYIILGLSIWLNWLIMDRYFFFLKIQPEISNKAISTWEQTDDKTSWLATVTSQRLISEVEVDMIRITTGPVSIPMMLQSSILTMKLVQGLPSSFLIIPLQNPEKPEA